MTDFRLAISSPGASFSTSDGTDISLFVRAITGISCFRGMDQIRQGSPPVAGTLATELDNINRDFSPGNMASDFYPFNPPLDVRLSSEETAAGSFSFLDGSDFDFIDGEAFESFSIPARNIWTGVYDDNNQNPQVGRLSVDLSALGNFSRLRGKVIPATPLYEGRRIDQLIGYVLDYAGWPSGERVLDESSLILPYFWADGADAFDLIVTLALTDGPNAIVYEDGAGRCVFKNNMARLTETISTVSQATFSAGVSGANIIDFAYTPRFKDIILAAQIQQVEREVQALTSIWSYGQTLTMTAGQVRTFIIRGSDPFKGAVVPSPVGTDEIQVLTPSVPLTSGDFILEFRGQQTTSLNWNDSAATIQAALEALSTIGSGNVLVLGSLTTFLTVVFRGTLKAQTIELLTVTSSLNPGTSAATVNAVDEDGTETNWRLYGSAPLASGTWKIQSVFNNKTSALAYTATALQIQNALIALPGIGPGDVTCSGGPINSADVSLAWGGAVGASNVVITDSTLTTSTDPTATLNVTRSVVGGGPDYVIAAGAATFALDRDNGAAVTLTVTAGASGATITGLQVRAMPVSVVRSNTIIYPTGFDPTLVRDGRVVTLNVLPEIPFDDAEMSTQEYYERYSVQRDAITVSVITPIPDSSSIDGWLALDMNYRTTIVEPQTGINTDYYVLQKRVFINPYSNYARFEYGTERAA